MKTLRLSVCLIVRDGASDLVRSLPSFAGVGDELIIVDTGSEDETKSVARRFTDRIYDFSWCDDFSAAKNEALRHATGDWVFFPDADEKLIGGREMLRRVVQEAAAEGVDVLSLFRHEVDEAGKPLSIPVNPAVRLFCRLPGLCYRDPVHEVLACPGKLLREKNVPEKQLYLLHWGYDSERLAEKRARNIAILEKAERMGLEKSYLHYYLTALYADAGRYEDACREAELSLAVGEHPPVGAMELWRRYYSAAKGIGSTRLQEALERGRREVPDLPDTYGLLGNLASEAGHQSEARAFFREALVREAVFSMRYPDEYDTFRSVVPQIERILQGEQEENIEMKQKKEKRDRVPKMEVDSKEIVARLVQRIPARAHVVVEFGCEDGELGAWFHRRQPACRWYGFDSSEANVQAAAARLYAVSCGTVDSVHLASYGIHSAEVLLYRHGETERLSLSVLRAHLATLVPHGVLLFELPAREEDVQMIQMLAQVAGLASVKLWHFPQMLVCMRAAERVPGIILQVMLGEKIACARPRILEPNEFLASQPNIMTQICGRQIDLGLGERFPIRVFLRQRLISHSMKEYRQLLAKLVAHRYLVVAELDDDPDRWHARYAASGFIDFCGAHAVQVSTEALARKMRRWNPHVYVFRNQLKELPPWKDRTAVKDDVVTIFFGALNRDNEYDDIFPILCEAARHYGERLRFLVLSDRAFFDGLPTVAKEFIGEKKDYGGKFVSYETYSATIDRADISMLPLHDTSFNRCKSDLKFIESAAHGAVVLASPTVYEETVVDGCTGFLYRNPQEFAEKLRILIEQPRRRQMMARAAYDYVKRERLQCQHYEERIAAYREMAVQYDVLDRELRERIAKLPGGN